MKSQIRNGTINRNDRLNWVEIVLSVSEPEVINLKRLDQWGRACNRVTVTGPGGKPARFPETIRWISRNPAEGEADLRNRFIREAVSEWVLFLEDDEQVELRNLQGLRKVLRRDQWVPSLIHNRPDVDIFRNYIQIRLVPKWTEPLFDGYQIPDATRTILENKIELSTRVVEIERTRCPVEKLKCVDGIAEPDDTPQYCLIQGEKRFREKKYAQAAAYFRRMLKVEHLLPFDRLAAVNGLASCMTEQYRWSQALSLAAQSLEAEPQQRLPYLIIYRISQLNKDWERSYEVLSDYHQMLSRDTRANFDKVLEETETLLQLAELARRTDRLERALDCYEHLVAIHPYDEENGWLKEALKLSVETGHFEKSVFYFRTMFEQALPDRLTPEQSEELYDIMSSFMEQGWYDYVSKVYERLYQEDTANNEYRRRLIVALSKSNRLEKARALIA